MWKNGNWIGLIGRKNFPMKIAKSRLIEVLKHLPEQVDLDDLMYRLYLLGKIEKGEADIRAGRTALNDKMLQKIKKW